MKFHLRSTNCDIIGKDALRVLDIQTITNNQKGRNNMNKFCDKCGSPIDQTTGKCAKCTQEKAIKAAEEKAKKIEDKTKKKEEKKRAWQEAKKRYKEDASAKKKERKKEKKSKKKAKIAAMSITQRITRVLLKFVLILIILALLVLGAYLGLRNLGILPDFTKGKNVEVDEPVTTTGPSDENEDNEDYNKENETKEDEENDNGSIGKDNPPTDSMPSDYEVSTIDADEYFNENSEVISEMDASSAGRTEAEAYQNLTERGFITMPITSEYTMDGVYSEAVEVSGTGTDKHPIYSTLYVTEDGFIWNVYEVNGAVIANPVSYNMEYEPDVQVMFSETETITSYDGTLNKFYVTKPKETALKVIVVEKIDAETLNTLTAREIDELCVQE